MTDPLLIKNARFVLSDRVTPATAWAVIENGVFKNLGDDNPPDMVNAIEAGGQYVLPGMVDLQINGGGGLNFNDVHNDQDLATILQANLSTGTTSLMATLITDTPDKLVQATERLATHKAGGAEVLGIHVEGPFLSPEKPGMHSIDKFSTPSVTIADKILQAGKGKIKIMTLAPELAGARDVIEYMTQHDVIVSMGHSMAGYEETEAAIDAGASMASHLFNTMPSIHHHKATMVPALLNSTIDIGIIADGSHVDERILQMVFKIVGPNFFLVSDAIAPLGSDKKEFDYYGTKVWVEGGVCFIREGIRAGSVTPLLNGVIRLHKKLGFLLPDAVAMATSTPAKIIGMADKIGSIDIGKQADFLILDRNFTLQQVFKNGQVFDRVFTLPV